MVIRTATAGDASGICDAHVSAIRVLNRAVYSAGQLEAWAGPRKPEDYQAPISNGRLFVAEEAGTIAGFSEYHGDEICAVYVHPRFSRQGIGRRLFQRVVQELARAGVKKAWLDASLSSVEFYRAMGCVGNIERVHRVGGGTELRCVRMDYAIADVVVRAERPSDIAQIHDVVDRAFQPYSLTSRTEPFIVIELRDAGELAISLVADLEGLIVGHVAVSPVVISDGAKGWYGLGPLAVAPAFQRRGIGCKLVGQALAELEQRGASGCVVLGNPAYYGRFGFRSRSDLRLPGAPPEHFQSCTFKPPPPIGSVAYHAAFNTSRSTSH